MSTSAGQTAAPCPVPRDGVVLCSAIAPGQDYFIEARIRPLPGGDASGQLYLLGRAADARHWLGAGLSVTDASPTVQAEIVRRDGDALERLKQVKRPMPIAGRLLTVRFEMLGQASSIYLDGEKLTTATLPGAPIAGQLGLYSKGKQFDVVDVRVGDMRVGDVRVGDPSNVLTRPMRIAPARGAHRFTAQAGDPPITIPISAFAGDGLTREAFTARVQADNGASAIVGVEVADGAIVATPLAPGHASITLTSKRDPWVQASIDAFIGPAFAMPGAKPHLAGAVAPPVRAADVPIDSTLRLKFDQIPTIGAGSVRIYRDDGLVDVLVDVIRAGEEVASIGYPGQDQTRQVRHVPITIDGNTAIIRPHPGRLAYGSTYTVVVEAGLFPDARLGGAPFAGIGKAAGWTFRTHAAAPIGKRLVVDDDGPAQFRTVQGALNHAMERTGRDTPVTIAIGDGHYDEMLFIRGKNQLTLRGQSREGVVIHNGNNDGYNPGSGVSQGPSSPGVTGGRALLLVEDADLLTLDTLTLKNTTLRSDKVSGQAETIYFGSEGGRLVAKNASFFSEQDTIQVKGYAWFYRTLIAGNVDFIWGANRVALFEESEIRSIGDTARPAGAGGYIVQARTVLALDKGFVFLNSRLTSGPGPGPAAPLVAAGSTYLARSPGTAATWDNVSFINCEMGPHIAPGGWAGQGVQRQPHPNPFPASADSGWREYGSRGLDGKPLDLAARQGGYLLSGPEAATRFANRALVFSAFDGGRGWHPAP